MFVKKDNAASVREVVERNTGIPADTFLSDVRDPHVDQLDEAVQFVKGYLDAHPGCRVTVVGDYDSDGINATSIMYWCFKKMGITPVLRLPRRMSEGYGLNEGIIDEIPDGLLITVDNGIAALGAVRKAKEKGLAVVVTDHHLPVRDKDGNLLLPEADVLLDPHVFPEKSEFTDYCGAALAYRFARTMFGAKFPELLVLASIATVTDVMPLVGPNRTLVKDGLGYINRRRVVPGLEELLKKLSLDDHISEGDYGFLIGPAFNAPGRLYDDGASRVVKLLCTKRGDFTARYKADNLVETNQKRKDTVKKCMAGVQAQMDGSRPVVIYDPSIPEGIVGIVAGQLAEKLYCPAVVFTDCGKEGIIKGSGRSGAGVNLKAVLDEIQDTIVGYGGHPGAAGLSIERDRLEEFKDAFKTACGDLPDAPKDLPYDLDLDPGRAEETMKALEEFAPFGEGNPQVRFHAVFFIATGSYRTIGDGTHFMAETEDGITVVGFGLSEKYQSLGFPEKIECAGYLTRSWWNGKDSLKFEILDFEAAE